MDADLQDEPEVIPEFVARHRAGADVVFARRRTREEGWLLRLAYRAFYGSFRRCRTPKLPLDTGDFALLGQPVVAALRGCPSTSGICGGCARGWASRRSASTSIVRRAQRAKPKYTTWKLLKLAVDGVCSFSIVPLRAAAVTGARGHCGLDSAFSIVCRVRANRGRGRFPRASRRRSSS